MEFRDPKVVLDSIGDGMVEVLEIGARMGEKEGVVMTKFAADLKVVAEDIKAKMPEDPSVLPKSVLKVGGAVVSGMFGTGTSIFGAVDETMKGIRSQIDRVIK